MSEFVLETKNLGISFGGLRAVSDVNLQIKEGEIYGLIGPNGAGKTTVFNLLTGVYQPTEGTFFLEGKELKRGEQIGKVGESAISELADEPHLHLEMTVNGLAVDPADYFSQEAKDTIANAGNGEVADK